ncbi:NAD(P)/FAD-dependent oxidoreductase [Mycobacterium deserti]|uniref:FAD-dependent monooxygenase n=1 Tax=Mycobacterium deserti TaxID=2978347 RepID=A0ABT2MLH0_9MYCO|nr:NAD(P)/FAD-dependent oxidoreductase [Mycobacterium deserti]MCT7661905.1 FAD-dependent monooxygenase [Mycobacterium deserti]
MAGGYMGIVAVGAGPTGLFTAIALARRGRDVTVIDRDPGPPAHGDWRRKGVMQFQHPHSFRGQVVEALRAEMPDVLDRLESSGAAVVMHGDRAAALHCRRMVFERELWRCAAEEPRLRLVCGHVDDVVAHRGRTTGVRVDGRQVSADLVIDASGRASRFTRALRGRGEGADCGATYVGRQYRLPADAPGGPTNSVIGLSLGFPEYGAVVFLHDSRVYTVALIHTGDDHRWHRLRHDDVFEAAVGAIPALADWIQPDRAVPIASVLPGGRLQNRYRGQLDDSGRPVLPGLISVGDSVCTTTPLAGRGVALALMQARELVRLLEDHRDVDAAAAEFDQWCSRRIKPWFADHVRTDGERVRRWSGHDVALDRPLPSDLVVAAAEADPRLADIVGPYITMDALPDSLAPAERRAREIFSCGWRPTYPPGPTRDELISVVSTTPAVA